MAPLPWTAPAITLVHDQPPTLEGLLQALAIADAAAQLLAEDDHGEALPHASTIRDECRSALALLEASSTRRRVTAERDAQQPAGPGESAHVGQLEPVLVACIELAADLLDNEDEPLDVSQVTAIGQAIGRLDTARWQCWAAGEDRAAGEGYEAAQ